MSRNTFKEYLSIEAYEQKHDNSFSTKNGDTYMLNPTRVVERFYAKARTLHVRQRIFSQHSHNTMHLSNVD
jgi:hypothetical protein